MNETEKKESCSFMNDNFPVFIALGLACENLIAKRTRLEYKDMVLKH